MNLPQAYIFDLDGTLVDSLRDISDALNAALSEHQLPRATPEQVRDWIGEGLRMLCARAIGGSSSRLLDRLIESARRHYSERCLANTRLYPNILEMLKLLKSRHARLAVLSNKPHALSVRIIDGLQVASMFDFVLGSMREEDRKPSTQGVERLLQSWRLQPEFCLFVGDSLIDIETARRAAMPVAAVTWGFRPADELQAASPDYLVDGPLEIPSIELR